MSIDILIYKTNNAILKYSNNNNILYLDIITNVLNINEIKIFIEYILNFFKYCNNNNLSIKIFYNLGDIKITNIPVMDIFNKIKHLFINLSPTDTKCVKSFVVIVNHKILKESLKLIFKIVKPIKPFKITKSCEKANLFINQ